MVLRLVVSIAAILLAHASPLAAADTPVLIHLGTVTFAVPPDWLELAGEDIGQGLTVTTVFLTPPPDSFDGKHGVAADGIGSITILIHTDSGNARQTFIEFPLARAAQRFGPATAEDAAIAFDGIAFDTLRGGSTASAGKSMSRPAILVGDMNVSGYGTVVVSTRIDRSTDGIVRGAYTITAMFEAKGYPFVMTIGLILSRPLRPTDLALIDFVAESVTAGIAD